MGAHTCASLAPVVAAPTDTLAREELERAVLVRGHVFLIEAVGTGLFRVQALHHERVASGVNQGLGTLVAAIVSEVAQWSGASALAALGTVETGAVADVLEAGAVDRLVGVDRLNNLDGLVVGAGAVARLALAFHRALVGGTGADTGATIAHQVLWAVFDASGPECVLAVRI